MRIGNECSNSIEKVRGDLSGKQIDNFIKKLNTAGFEVIGGESHGGYHAIAEGLAVAYITLTEIFCVNKDKELSRDYFSEIIHIANSV